MPGTGGTAVDVGFDGANKKGGGGKGPPRQLVERLSKRPERAPKQRAQREAVFKEAAAPKDGSRASVRVNPVTGKMTTVVKKGGKDMVREGSMYIPKEYLHAAAEAGLGNSNGMYSHLSGLRRELGGGHNVGAGQAAASNPRGSGGFKPTVSNVGGRVHKLDTGSKPPGSNIKRVVQGRSRSISGSSGSGNGAHESSYTRRKGVVNNLGGCARTTGAKQQERKTGIASLGSSGGRSFIKHEKPKQKQAAAPKRAADPVPLAATPHPVGISKKLGTRSNPGAAGGQASGGTNMSDREKRAAYFAQKFGKA